MKKQFVIILEGPMGAGKTTIASLLHPRLPRTAWLGMDKIKWILSDFQRNKDYELINKVMFGIAKTFLEAGCSLLIDQAFWKKTYVDSYIDFANEMKIPLNFYQLEAPIEILRERAENRPDTPNKPPMTPDRIEENLKKWQENRYEFGKTFDTSKYSVEEVAEMIIQDLQ